MISVSSPRGAEPRLGNCMAKLCLLDEDGATTQVWEIVDEALALDGGLTSH